MLETRKIIYPSAYDSNAATRKPSVGIIDPMQFVKVGTSGLHVKAKEQLQATHKRKESPPLNEDNSSSPNWQSDFSSWKEKRRQMSQSALRRVSACTNVDDTTTKAASGRAAKLGDLSNRNRLYSKSLPRLNTDFSTDGDDVSSTGTYETALEGYSDNDISSDNLINNVNSNSSAIEKQERSNLPSVTTLGTSEKENISASLLSTGSKYPSHIYYSNANNSASSSAMKKDDSLSKSNNSSFSSLPEYLPNNNLISHELCKSSNKDTLYTSDAKSEDAAEEIGGETYRKEEHKLHMPNDKGKRQDINHVASNKKGQNVQCSGSKEIESSPEPLFEPQDNNDGLQNGLERITSLTDESLSYKLSDLEECKVQVCDSGFMDKKEVSDENLEDDQLPTLPSLSTMPKLPPRLSMDLDYLSDILPLDTTQSPHAEIDVDHILSPTFSQSLQSSNTTPLPLPSDFFKTRSKTNFRNTGSIEKDTAFLTNTVADSELGYQSMNMPNGNYEKGNTFDATDFRNNGLNHNYVIKDTLLRNKDSEVSKQAAEVKSLKNRFPEPKTSEGNDKDINDVEGKNIQPICSPKRYIVQVSENIKDKINKQEQNNSQEDSQTSAIDLQNKDSEEKVNKPQEMKNPHAVSLKKSSQNHSREENGTANSVGRHSENSQISPGMDVRKEILSQSRRPSRMATNNVVISEENSDKIYQRRKPNVNPPLTERATSGPQNLAGISSFSMRTSSNEANNNEIIKSSRKDDAAVQDSTIRQNAINNNKDDLIRNVTKSHISFSSKAEKAYENDKSNLHSVDNLSSTEFIEDKYIDTRTPLSVSIPEETSPIKGKTSPAMFTFQSISKKMSPGKLDSFFSSMESTSASSSPTPISPSRGGYKSKLKGESQPTSPPTHKSIEKQQTSHPTQQTSDQISTAGAEARNNFTSERRISSTSLLYAAKPQKRLYGSTVEQPVWKSFEKPEVSETSPNFSKAIVTNQRPQPSSYRTVPTKETVSNKASNVPQSNPIPRARKLDSKIRSLSTGVNSWLDASGASSIDLPYKPSDASMRTSVMEKDIILENYSAEQQAPLNKFHQNSQRSLSSVTSNSEERIIQMNTREPQRLGLFSTSNPNISLGHSSSPSNEGYGRGRSSVAGSKSLNLDERNYVSPPLTPINYPPIHSRQPSLSPGGHVPEKPFIHKRKFCSVCQEKLGRGAAMHIESLGVYFHLGCFHCSVCKANFPMESLEEGADVRFSGGTIHCASCFSNDKGIIFSEV